MTNFSRIVRNDQSLMDLGNASLSQVRPDARAGSLTLLKFERFPPEAIHLEEVPCSVMGPPRCVALHPQNPWALVAAAMRLDPQDARGQSPDNRVTLVDFAKNPPHIRKTLQVGRQPSAVRFAPDGQKALVSNRADGSLTILQVTSAGIEVSATAPVCQPDDDLADVAVCPDGRQALASLHGPNAIVAMSIDGEAIQVEQRLGVGKGPYALDVTGDGQLAVVANMKDGTVSILDLEASPLVVTDTLFVGILPEGLVISPDGQWLAVACMQYTLVKPTDPKRQNAAQLVLLQRQGRTFRICQRQPIARIPQAVTFSPKGKYVIVSSYEKKQLALYRLVGRHLEDTGIRIPTPGQPAALSLTRGS